MRRLSSITGRRLPAPSGADELAAGVREHGAGVRGREPLERSGQPGVADVLCDEELLRERGDARERLIDHAAPEALDAFDQQLEGVGVREEGPEHAARTEASLLAEALVGDVDEL